MTTPPPTDVAEGRFTTERLLGTGGMGSVWLARDANLKGRPVALKLLHPRVASQALGARFRREATLMARLRHPGLIDVYDVCLTGPHPYIAQEYVEGSDLADLLARSGPLPAPSCLRLARELAETLAYLHEQGVIHRDIKPSNVMIQRDGRSRLADLGLARDEGGTRFTEEGTMVGTVLYMAPENILDGTTTAASDVFSYGLVLWEAATCRHPLLDSVDLGEYMARVVRGAVPLHPPPPGLPPPLTALMLACLQTDPSKRPQDGAALVAILDGKGPVVAQRLVPPPPEPAPRAASKAPTAPPLVPPPPGPVRAAAVATTALVLGALLLLLLARAPSTSSTPFPAVTLQPRVACLLDGLRLDCPGTVPEGFTARLTTPGGELLTERPLRGGTVTLHAPSGFAGPVRWSLHGPGAALEGEATVGLRLLYDPAPDLMEGQPTVEDGCLVLSLHDKGRHVLRPRRLPGRPLELVLEGSPGGRTAAAPSPSPALALSLPTGVSVAARGNTLVWTNPDGTWATRTLELGVKGAVAALLPGPDGGVVIVEAALTAPPAETLVTLDALVLPGTADDAPLPPPTRLAIVEAHIRNVLPLGSAALPRGGFALVGARTLLVCQDGVSGPRDAVPLPERCLGLVWLDGTLLVAARSGRVYGVETGP